MSRAFVKEPDGDQVINELPDRVHSPHVNYGINGTPLFSCVGFKKK